MGILDQIVPDKAGISNEVGRCKTIFWGVGLLRAHPGAESEEHRTLAFGEQGKAAVRQAS